MKKSPCGFAAGAKIRTVPITSRQISPDDTVLALELWSI
jgi:hypothetical protein